MRPHLLPDSAAILLATAIKLRVKTAVRYGKYAPAVFLRLLSRSAPFFFATACFEIARSRFASAAAQRPRWLTVRWSSEQPFSLPRDSHGRFTPSERHYYKGVSGGGIRINRIKPSEKVFRHCHCERRRSRSVAIALARRGGTKYRKNSPRVTVFSQSGEATTLRAGREDLLAYTDEKPFPWGISPLRSDCRPHSGRNDILKPNVHIVISSVVEKSPKIETARHVPAPARSPAAAHRRRSSEQPFPLPRDSHGRFTPSERHYYNGVSGGGIRINRINPSEKVFRHCHCERRRSRSVAISRKGNVAHVPAPAKCPRGFRAKTRRTPFNPRHLDRSDSVAERSRGSEDLSAYTTNPILARAGSAPPAVAHRREIPCERNDKNHTRLTQILAGAGSAPAAHRRESLRAGNENNRSFFRFIPQLQISLFYPRFVLDGKARTEYNYHK